MEDRNGGREAGVAVSANDLDNGGVEEVEDLPPGGLAGVLLRVAGGEVECGGEDEDEVEAHNPPALRRFDHVPDRRLLKGSAPFAHRGREGRVQH